MAEIGTGNTVHEVVLSIDSNNNPISGATFSLVSYRDGNPYMGLSPNIVLTDASTGAFDLSFSASTTGIYQVYAKNNNTNVLFVSDIYEVKTDEELSTIVYVGV